MRRVSLPIVVSALLTSAAIAQSPAPPVTDLPERPLFRVFGTAHGLPSSTVHKLAQDRTGNLWIATLDGLARFDGVDFEVWRHDPDQPGSLPGNDVQQVVVDGDNAVWLAIQDAGIARHDPVRNEFRSWRHDPADPTSLPTDRIWALTDDGAGGVWVGGYRGGLSRMDADGRFEHHRHDPSDSASLCDDIILSLARTGDVLWIGTARGLCRWRVGDGFSSVAIPPVPGGAEARFVADIEVDGNRLWLSTNVGLRAITRDGSATTLTIPAGLGDVQGSAATVEPDGQLWYASADGVRRWQPDGGEVIVHHARPGQALSLQAAGFLDVLRDREGSLWFASEGGGLAQLLPHWRAIRVFLPSPDDPAGLPGGRVRLVSADADGHLWIAANVDDGVAELNPATGIAIRRFRDGDGISQPDPQLLAVLRDDDGQLWTGHRGRIARYDLDSGAYRHVDADRDGTPLPATLVRRLATLGDGSVLAAFGGGGVARVARDSMATDFNALGVDGGLPCAEIADIRSDARGGTWLACEHGVLHAARGSLAFVPVVGAPAAAIDGIAFGADGHLWLHTLGLLGQFRIEEGALIAVRSIGADDGWPVVRAGGLAIDGDGIVWATTSRGLFSYDPVTRRVGSYDENDGLPSAEFSPTPPAQLSPDLLAAGTVAGPVIIDTGQLRQPLPQSQLRWHRAQVSRSASILPLSFDPVNPVELAYDDRDLRVAVRMDSFAKPGAHRYRFRLTDYDDDWVQLTGTPERVFERLPSGRYELSVEAIGSDGQSAANSLTQAFVVGLPPWRQPWAFAFYVLLALGILYGVLRASRRRLENRYALSLAEERQHWAEQASEAKTRFLASVGHEIRTPMAGLLGMNSLLLDSPLEARQRHYARSVQQAGQHMLTLVNDLLDLSRIEAGNLVLEPAATDLVALLDQLIVDVAAAAEKKGLTLSLRIEPGTPLCVHADGKRLKQILLNFLSNAIKFTSSRVRLRLRHDGQQHVFSVGDDGPGLSEDMRQKLFTRYSQDALGRSSGGTGLGLSIAHELAALKHGAVGADNRSEGGTDFWLRVPFAVDTSIRGIRISRLPSLLIVDDDAARADDLATCLRTVGLRSVAWASDAAPDIRRDTIVLVAAASDDTAADALERRQLGGRPRVVALPLAAPAAARPGARHLPGPWRIGATIDAIRSLQADAAEPSAPLSTGARSDLSGLHLLIVEDDPILCEVLSARMTGMGATLATAPNGLVALGQLGSARFDAVLLDLDLPEIDGLQLLKLMRSRMGDDAPPVLIVTARQQADDESQCREAGASAFFRKPVDPEALALRILDLAAAR